MASGDAEKKMFSLQKSMNATATATSNLMGTMKSLNDSKIWTIFSRSASGIFPQVWQIQNKFRAVTDAFVGYERHINKSREATLEKMETFSALQDQLDMFPDVLLDENFFDMIGLEQWLDIAKKEVKEFPFFQLLAEDGTGTKDELMKMLSGRKSEMETKRDNLQKEHKDREERMAPLHKALEGLDPKKDKMKIFWERMKFHVGLAVKGTAKFMTTALMWFTGITLGLAIIVAWFKKSGEQIAPWIALIKDGFILLIEGIAGILKGIIWIIGGALTGDIDMVMRGIFEGLLGGALTILIGLAEIGLGILGTIIIGLFGPILKWLKITGENTKSVKAQVGLLGKALLILGSIALIISMLPATLVATLPAALAGFAIGIGQSLMALIGGFLFSTIGKAHTGGMRSGLTLVGEKGPELVSLPKGSRVHSNYESSKMGGGNTINVHVNGRVGASDAEIRDIADKVGREINLRMNRTTSTQVRF